MTRDYALSRVQDALAASDNDPAKARKLLLTWLEKDQSLLIGLVAPHLNSIISHTISYALRHPDEKIETSLNSESSADEDTTGTAILESLLGLGEGGGQRFGDLDEPLSRPGKASSKHIDAIHRIARKKDEE